MKIHNPILREAVVGGATGVAVVLFFIVLKSVIDGVASSDWLRFAGTILGTTFAVFGAGVIEHYKRKLAKDEAVDALRDAILEAREAMRDYIAPWNDLGTPDLLLKQKVVEIISRRERLSAAHELLKFVISRYSTPNILTWRRFQIIGECIEKAQSIVWSFPDHLIGEETCNDQSVSDWRSRTDKIIRPIIPLVSITKDELKG